MILLTDTFGVEQIVTGCTVTIEKVEIEEVQAALADGFDVYFEFEELALDAQDVLDVQVPETEQQHRPRFDMDFTLIVVGYEVVEIPKGIFVITFWKVQDVVAQARESAARRWAHEKDFSEVVGEAIVEP